MKELIDAYEKSYESYTEAREAMLASVPEYLREVRHKLGLTQVEMAELLETTTGYIVQIETGNSRPGIEFIKKIIEQEPERN